MDLALVRLESLHPAAPILHAPTGPALLDHSAARGRSQVQRGEAQYSSLRKYVVAFAQAIQKKAGGGLSWRHPRIDG
jgi:hypothetical protein